MKRQFHPVILVSQLVTDNNDVELTTHKELMCFNVCKRFGIFLAN